ncbi:MAG: beta-ketoacyl-ACP synthase II [Chloroflexota bacterium]
MRRVVITGIGAVTPVGQNAEQSWESVVAGRSGVGHISLFDSDRFDVKIAGEVSGWEPSDFISGKDVRRRDRYQLLAHSAIQQGMQSAGLEDNNMADPYRVGVMVGSSIGGMTSFSEQLHRIDAHGPRRMAPFGIPSFMTTTGSSMGSVSIGAMGASYIITSACATGSDCIGNAFDRIRLNRADVMVAGAAEAPILPNSIAGFDRLGACSHQNDVPQKAMRPFDRNRTGLVVSEGAAVVVLEALEHAQARGAEILGEVIGYGASSDAYHMVAPHPEGDGAVIAIKAALQDAGVNADNVDYINAHGTSTQLNDPMETHAIKRAFGEEAYNIPVSSTKSMTGHAMGASGAMETIFAVLALRDQIVPPTINLEEPDADCDLDYVPNVAREVPLDIVMTNAFGFGGHNSVLVLKRYRGD